MVPLKMSRKGDNWIYIKQPIGNTEAHSVAVGETQTDFRAAATVLVADVQTLNSRLELTKRLQFSQIQSHQSSK